MIRPRRASVIATLSLLAWATTANAECKWVLWDHFSNWEPKEAFDTRGRV
jgi:hypothetical protein